MFALWPARIRMDVIGPMNIGVVATLTSDKAFALADLREKRFFYGPASACNIGAGSPSRRSGVAAIR